MSEEVQVPSCQSRPPFVEAPLVALVRRMGGGRTLEQRVVEARKRRYRRERKERKSDEQPSA